MRPLSPNLSVLPPRHDEEQLLVCLYVTCLLPRRRQEWQGVRASSGALSAILDHCWIMSINNSFCRLGIKDFVTRQLSVCDFDSIFSHF